jgi:pyruvate/2-oxoglutarate dehydrogenase complex dihydrolipoamide dehydrogenase (E3) component/uncharacterized membrane protein YdjX (TVP38/TMEM64 family)
VVVVLVFTLAIGLYFLFDIQRFIKADFFLESYREQPWFTAGIYFLLYILTTALSIPVGALLTMAGGAVFGLKAGVVLVSFASTIGATLAFFISRTVLREWVQNRFKSRLEAVNRGIEKNGAFYLFSLRLVPLFPFWVINLLMGLTPIKMRTYFLVSQVGMLPATVIFVNAGAELAAIEELSVAGVLTPGLLVSFGLLALLPFIGKAVVATIKRQRAYRPFRKPRQFDANLLVIGGGSAGLVASLIGAAVKAKVMLVEKAEMGGDCLNRGCVPSKALIHAARSVADIRKAPELGIDVDAPGVDFPRVMSRVGEVIKTIAPHDSVKRFTELGVECLSGNATLISPWQARVNDRVVAARNIIIATGAAPLIPPIPGIDQVDYLTSDNLWDLREHPVSLLVLGAGPVGCELAQAFQRLGTQVTLVDMMPRVLPRDDHDASDLVSKALKREGVEVLLNHKTIGFEKEQDADIALLEYAGEEFDEQSPRRLMFDKLLVAVGRVANIKGFGVEELGIETTAQGTLEVDEYLRTNLPNIYACGDVVGPFQFTHTAAHQAWYAVVNSLFGGLKKYRVDYRVIPWTTFTEPEVACVGLIEADAKQRGIAHEVTTYPLRELDRAIVENNIEGFVKVMTVPGKDRILGATVVGPHAGELLTEFVTAMKYNIGLNKILGTIHAYPTFSEANKMVAGLWKRGHTPEKLLHYVGKYHYLRLGRKTSRGKI